jgi:NO-binding membrane sensor protein with MHYT domain
MSQLHGYYSTGLVALSVIIAVLASGAALDLTNRVTAARARARVLWLVGGAFAMGLGIWSMHYVGMLAFHLPIPVLYDVPTVIASLLAAVFASAVALFVVSRRALGPVAALVSSIMMGTGIAAMHYTGMAAMRMPARITYHPFLFTLSVVIAIIVALVALILTYELRSDAIRPWDWRRVGSTLLMGAAIPAMHYTGMAAAQFFADSVRRCRRARRDRHLRVGHGGHCGIGLPGSRTRAGYVDARSTPRGAGWYAGAVCGTRRVV